MVERVKALWRTDRHEEAELVAVTGFETLPVESRINLSSWLCYAEMSEKCTENLPTSCEELVKGLHARPEVDLPPSGWLGLVLVKEKCENQAKPNVYSEMIQAVGPGEVSDFLESLQMFSKGQVKAAQSKMENLVLNGDDSDLVRAEGLRRLIIWNTKGEDLKPWIANWKEFKPGPRRSIGPQFFRALVERGELESALEVGRQLVEESPEDLDLMRDLVVAVYRSGNEAEAWQRLLSYENATAQVHSKRQPATADEFQTVAMRLKARFEKR